MNFMKSVQDNKKVKLSDKQKEVIRLMREGCKLHYITGYNAQVFLSHNNKISFPTFFKLDELGMFEEMRSNNLTLNKTYCLSELGKTIQL